MNEALMIMAFLLGMGGGVGLLFAGLGVGIYFEAKGRAITSRSVVQRNQR